MYLFKIHVPNFQQTIHIKKHTPQLNKKHPKAHVARMSTVTTLKKHQKPMYIERFS